MSLDMIDEPVQSPFSMKSLNLKKAILLRNIPSVCTKMDIILGKIIGNFVNNIIKDIDKSLIQVNLKQT